MSYIRDKVIVLKSEPFRENDTRISMYGKDHGKLIAVARSSRRLGAKQLGHLEPLSLADVMIAQGKSFDKLAVAHLLSFEAPVRERFGALTVGGQLCGLVDELTLPGIRDRAVFDLLEEVLRALSALEEPLTQERARLLSASAALRLLNMLGYGPDIAKCIRCQATLSDPATLFARLCGFACSACTTSIRSEGLAGIPLPPQTLRLLSVLSMTGFERLFSLRLEVRLIQAAAECVDEFLLHLPTVRAPRTTAHVLPFFQ